MICTRSSCCSSRSGGARRRPRSSAGLVEDKVQEEILYREALALGLDKDDTIVKRRMAQKMQFLAEDVAAAREPTSAELESLVREESGTFALPERASASDISTSRPTVAASVRAPTRRGAGQAGGRVRGFEARERSLADPFMLQDYYADRAPDQLAKDFGPRSRRRSSACAGLMAGPDRVGLRLAPGLRRLARPGARPTSQKSRRM